MTEINHEESIYNLGDGASGVDQMSYQQEESIQGLMAQG